MKLTTKKRLVYPIQDAFARYLLENDIITQKQLIKAFKIQSEVNRKIGELAIDEGVLENEEVTKILEEQKCIKKNFGALAVQMNLMSQDQLEFLLNQQQQHYVSLVDVFLHENMLSMEQCAKELLYFKSQNPDYKIPLSRELNDKMFLHKQLQGAIVGDIKAIGLGPVLQMLAMYEKTGVCKIYKGKDKIGRIAINSGKVTYSECQEKYGRPAFFDLLGVLDGKFEFYEGDILKDRIMYDEVEFLLLEYAKDLDEEQR